MFIVSFGNPSNPETVSFIHLGDALSFAKANTFAKVYNEENEKFVCWLRGRWFSNMLAEHEIFDDIEAAKILEGN